MVDTFISQSLAVPPLESGDRLTRDEFERRSSAMPELKKAELIEGVVYLPAALRFRSHGQPHGRLITWLGIYEALTPGVALGDTPTVRLDLNNDPQPDAVLLIADGSGQSRISKDDYIEGAPELVAEIAASSVAIDLFEKKWAYCRNRVQEYIVWQVFEQKIDWFYLQEDKYVSLPVDDNGVVCSRVFPGLWLAVNALLSGDMAQVLAVLQAGIASPEHQAFVNQRLGRDPIE